LNPSASKNPLHIKGRIPALDGLRGLAILMVLFHHLWPYAWQHPAYKILTYGKQVGWLGVDLFFVLSGFLITGILLDTQGQPGYLKNFLARRSLRVFPLYFFFLFVSLSVMPGVLQWLGDSPEAARAYESRALVPWLVTYTTNVLPIIRDPNLSSWFAPQQTATEIIDYLAVTWSLCVEEQFYIFWPCLLLFSGRWRRHLPSVAIASALACRAFAVLALENWQQVTYLTTFCRLDGLALGAGIAMYVRSDSFNPIHWRRFVRIGIWCVIPSVLLWVAFGAGRSDPLFAVAGYSLATFGAASLLGAAIDSRSKSPLQWVLENRCLRWFGTYSYGLYLYHMLVLTVLAAWRPANVLPNGQIADPDTFAPFGGSLLVDAPVRLLLAAGVSCAVAWLSYHWLELPFLRWKNFFEPRAAKPAPARLGKGVL